MSYIPDPSDYFEDYDYEQQEKLDRLPLCECCNEPIQQESAIYYNDQWCCEGCEDIFWAGIREDFLKETVDEEFEEED